MSNPTSKWGALAARILDLLRDYGPMTRAELGAYLDHTASSISPVLARMTKTTPKRPQRLHVGGWVTDHEGQRHYPRPVYHIGPGVNKRYKPELSAKQAHAKRQSDKLRMLKTSSVFNLGVTRQEFAQRRRAALSIESPAPYPRVSAP